MLQQIEALLTAPSSGAAAPTLARLEDTLTEGYAQALALEAERLRLEQRLGEVARTIEGPDVSSFADELSSLAKRLTRADGELSHLRARLSSLYERTRRMRLAARTS
jgi:ABC-type phosphate transport system auxiliary subunit